MHPITTFTAAILGAWLIVLSARVIRMRGKAGVAIGDGGNDLLSRRIRAHGNFCEYAPLALILLFLAEAQGANFWLLTISALLLLAGRLMHGTALSFTTKWVLGRVGGMIATFGAIGVLVLANLWVLASS